MTEEKTEDTEDYLPDWWWKFLDVDPVRPGGGSEGQQVLWSCEYKMAGEPVLYSAAALTARLEYITDTISLQCSLQSTVYTRNNIGTLITAD